VADIELDCVPCYLLPLTGCSFFGNLQVGLVPLNHNTGIIFAFSPSSRNKIAVRNSGPTGPGHVVTELNALTAGKKYRRLITLFTGFQYLINMRHLNPITVLSPCFLRYPCYPSPSPGSSRYCLSFRLSHLCVP
jgi:hypothetical protein